MSRGRTVFLVAVGIIAVHIIDDSWVNPEPGTSAGDHVFSGGLTLVALGVATVLYLVSSDGVRAAIAVVLGVFALVVSAEGWYAVREGVQSGDDYTGLLVAPAGLVLLSLAVVLLWQSRRTEGSRTWRYLRRGLIAVVGFVVLVWVVLPFMLTYAFTHVARAEVPPNELGGAEYADVSFETSDGLELEGWYLPSRNGAAVIAFPGRGNDTQNPARFLAEAGYGVLLFDTRGDAASEGDPNAFGWDRATDVEAGVAFLQRQPDVEPERIGGIGYSVGGEMLLEAAATNDDLKAVVSEGAGIRSYKEALELNGAERWLQFPLWGSTALGTALFSDTTPPANLKDLVPDISPRPVFFIHAERGQGGEQLTAEYFEAAGEPKELWKTNSTHIHGYDADPEEYTRRVTEFFDNALQ